MYYSALRTKSHWLPGTRSFRDFAGPKRAGSIDGFRVKIRLETAKRGTGAGVEMTFVAWWWCVCVCVTFRKRKKEKARPTLRGPWINYSQTCTIVLSLGLAERG